MTSIDKDYYRQRVIDERERMAAALTPFAAQVHAELADAYERMLHEAEGQAER